MRYPIGQQDFAYLRTHDYVYADKSDIIFKLVDYKYIFLARPRRFGKSLLLSTIKAYFEGRKELFRGLAIESLEKEWKKYPVFLLQLARIKTDTHEALKDGLDQQFEVWEKELGIVNSNPDFGSRFSTILIESYKKTGREAVVLVDEYDNPMINTLHIEELNEKNRILLKSIYSNLKDMDGYIRFGMLAGVSRFSKMTVFSGLNNLKDISFESRFASICGITEDELKTTLLPGVEEMAKENGVSTEEMFLMLKENYDGYHFSEKCPDIYNPFSLLSALDTKKIAPYWLETAVPSFLVMKLRNTPIPFSEIFQDTVEEYELAAPDTAFSSPVAILYQTGYLTIKSYDKKSETYKVGIPNREVEKGFLPYLLGELIGKDKGKTKKEAALICNSLINGDIETFMEQLGIFLSSVPYDVMPKLSEKYFQNTLYLLFSIMGLDIETEKPNAYGRSDIIVKTDRFIYIFELKLDKTPQEALSQIKNKGYALPYANDSRKLYEIGINFSSQTRNLDSWLIS